MSGDVRGCFIGHSAMESSDRSDEMRARLGEILDEWRSGFTSALVDGGLSQQNADGTALIALAAIEGAILLARATPDDAKLLATFDALEKMLLDAIE